MTTFDIPVSQIDASLLERLVANAVQEGRQLEYKEALPGRTPDEKREFLYDISAFANTAGGDLIYGVREKRDENGKPTGEPESIVGLPGANLDDEKLRLENLIRDCIEPRIRVAVEKIDRRPDPPCLLVRVNSTWLGLHMVKTVSNPFYGRNSGGKYPLSITEIRTGFLSAETSRDRVRRFRIERIERIIAGDTPTVVGDGSKLIFHGLPLSSTEEVWVRFRDMMEGGESTQRAPIQFQLRPMGGDIRNWNYNLDGFVSRTERSSPPNCYVQLFRDGGIEAVGVRVIDPYRPTSVPPFSGFTGDAMEREVIQAYKAYTEFWSRIGVEPPISIGLAITGVKGHGIFSSRLVGRTEDVVFDRDPLISPEVLVDDLSIPADVVLKPVFDFFWNGGGWPESPHYRDGRWFDRG